ncbi:hypothetical protein L596_005439 [Steinernema carpocapsae]|uniref:Secreted protein n=1 Tax=Steinernema carpocapsae TaxID=34508 RepID=A0A4U8UZ11_STECR|nr:hypothetical protein L596_005439 [Steinernema carpocapsae]
MIHRFLGVLLKNWSVCLVLGFCESKQLFVYSSPIFSSTALNLSLEEDSILVFHLFVFTQQVSRHIMFLLSIIQCLANK